MLLVHASHTPLAPDAPAARFKVGGIECFVVALDDGGPAFDAILGTFTVAGQRYGILAEAHPAFTPDLVDLLTPRELEIAVLVAAGCDSKAIARRLRISFHTVRVHLARTYAKLGLHKYTSRPSWRHGLRHACREAVGPTVFARPALRPPSANHPPACRQEPAWS
jgi:DNA-binding CsgD family transcriptional regulator